MRRFLRYAAYAAPVAIPIYLLWLLATLAGAL